VFVNYFNPRTREGCDEVSGFSRAYEDNFNPRTREGCDLFDSVQVKDVKIISTHAPAKGATLDILTTGNNLTDFNPRTREGCDAFSG